MSELDGLDDNLTISISYGRDNDDRLNKKLDACARMFGGVFVSHMEKDQVCIRKFTFITDADADDFMEQANFIISRHFTFEPINLEEFSARVRWSFEEAVFHHVEFSVLEPAQRFATWMRACLGTYLEVEMFDIFLINPLDENTGYIVVYAFPFESVLPEDLLGDEDEREIDNLMSSINVKKDKGMLN